MRFSIGLYLLIVGVLASCRLTDRREVKINSSSVVQTSSAPTAQSADLNQAQPCRTVVKDPDGEVNVRSEPIIKPNNVLGTISNGSEVKVVEQIQSWLKISLPKQGWIHESKTAQICNSKSLPKLQQSFMKDDLRNLLQLQADQIHQLSTLEGIHIYSEAGKGTFKVTLPTHIPARFTISEFRAKKHQYRPEYSIIYKNEKNQCFAYGSHIPGAGSPSSDNPPFEVRSVGLGRMLVEYVEYDHVSDKHLVTTSRVMNGQVYWFSSPIGFDYSYTAPNRYDTSQVKCEPISQQEAIKIIESIDYVF